MTRFRANIFASPRRLRARRTTTTRMLRRTVCPIARGSSERPTCTIGLIQAGRTSKGRTVFVCRSLESHFLASVDSQHVRRSSAIQIRLRSKTDSIPKASFIAAMAIVPTDIIVLLRSSNRSLGSDNSKNCLDSDENKFTGIYLDKILDTDSGKYRISTEFYQDICVLLIF